MSLTFLLSCAGIQYSSQPAIYTGNATRLDVSLEKVPENDPGLLQRPQLPRGKHADHVAVRRANLRLVDRAPERHLLVVRPSGFTKTWNKYTHRGVPR